VTKELELKQMLNTLKSLMNRNFPPQTPTSTDNSLSKRKVDQNVKGNMKKDVSPVSCKIKKL
jgi:hypothetical protein